MREQPPLPLVGMLQRLGLAPETQIRRMARRVRRLARDLPRFESIWVDALAQSRVLTAFQAAEINAGRGGSLGVGPYVLCGSLRWPEYAGCYRARHVKSGEAVRLTVVENAGKRAEDLLGRLQSLAHASKKLQSKQLAPIRGAGSDGERIWAATPWIEGSPAAEWMVHNGRFPPEVVLHIARAMLAGLVELERAGLCHGDISASGLLLTDAGSVVLLQPGLRAIVRPEEGYAHANLRPEAYDYLAPERITDGTPPTTASDLYACGCVWWHLLCGRPPLSGGNSLAKLRAAQAAGVFDVRRLAPEVPGPLAAAVSACLETEPRRRPESMARLAAALGPATRCGAAALVRCMARSGRSAARWALSARTIRHWSRAPLWLAAVAGCLIAAAAILWPTWRHRALTGGDPQQSAASPPQHGPAGKDGVGVSQQQPADHCPSGQRYSGTFSENPVVAADYEVEQPASEAAADAPQDLVLASGGPLVIESLQLTGGQCVRGMPGQRPLVVVPRTGLVVAAENVRFENVDFSWDHPPEASHAVKAPAAIIDLRAGRAEFRGCLFRSAHTPLGPAAIRWTHPAEPNQSPLSLPSGRVQLENCVLRRVETGVDCHTVGARAVELTNTLYLCSGPLVRLDHCPKSDEPVLIATSQVTLRGGGPLLECRYALMDGQPGEISIQSVGCAFVPGPGTPLLRLTGPEPPERLLGNLRWTGQGSLVSPGATIAAWRPPDGAEEVLDDAAVSIAGLVRSEVGFAGDAESDPAASRIIRWQVPLRSTDPPGIAPGLLPAGEARPDDVGG